MQALSFSLVEVWRREVKPLERKNVTAHAQQFLLVFCRSWNLASCLMGQCGGTYGIDLFNWIFPPFHCVEIRSFHVLGTCLVLGLVLGLWNSAKGENQLVLPPLLLPPFLIFIHSSFPLFLCLSFFSQNPPPHFRISSSFEYVCGHIATIPSISLTTKFPSMCFLYFVEHYFRSSTRDGMKQ